PTIGAPYTFTIMHDDGAYFGFTPGVSAASSFTPPTNITGHNSTVYNISNAALVGNNNSVAGGGEGATPASGVLTETGAFTFPNTGVFILESNWVNWENAGVMVVCNNGPFVAG